MISKNLLLATLAIGSLCTNYLIDATNSLCLNQNKQDIVDEPEGCTIMYIGRDASEDGHAIIARSSDAGPNSMQLHTQLFKHNELANETIKGNNGFLWKMPSTTYEYISTPRNSYMGKGLHWEASAINENGVGVSATLSCSTRAEAGQADPHEPEGISEDNIAQVVGATARTAKDGIQTIASIVDQQGSKDANAIMVIDQNEAWYMELYTGHQYIAIKLPDDKACTIGNEFMLDSLNHIFGADLNYDNIICSPKLFTLPKEGSDPFAIYDAGHETTREDEYLDLFNTYATHLTDDPQKIVGNDNSHRRTWRGISMFKYESHNDPNYESYVPTTKYSSFFEPYRKLGINDVKSFMRDRFESILNDATDPDYGEFTDAAQHYNLRPVAAESAYQIHIIQSYPELPKEMACVEYLCISNSNYSPFVPFNNAATSLNDYYTYIPESYSYNENVASCIYKALNYLCAISRQYYGMPTLNLIQQYEYIWYKQYWDVLNKVKNLKLSKAKDIITNFTKHLQQDAIDLATQLQKTLLIHVENDLSSTIKDPTLFHPLIDAEEYAKLFGWTYKKDGMVATLHNDNGNYHNIVIDSNCTWTQNGKITIDDQEPISKPVCYMNDRIYFDLDVANEFVRQEQDPVEVDINDWKTHSSNKYWIIPVVISVFIIIGGIILALYLIKRKSLNKNKNV